jgi:glyoxylase-like metal-dependent hydrolase (beta-lactamase superfamily II)
MIKTFNNGLLESNVHIYSNNGEAMIIDCGAPVSKIRSYVIENALTVKFIVLTHGHFDHVAFIDEYANAFPDAKIICHESEKAVLYNPEANLSPYFSAEAIYDHPYTTVKHGDTIKVGGSEFNIIHAPGHTPGCICLYCKDENIMFTGDVLFDGSYGRTDFPYGDMAQMFKSLKMLLKMDGDITFYPGHYGASKIKDNTYLIF